MKEYDFASLRSFATVVETGSFAKAADQLNVSTAAVSRRISALEEMLGTRLIARTTRRLDLTDAGKSFYEDVTNVFHMLDEADERVRIGSETIKGNLRIATPLSFGFEKIAPLLPAFMKQYPELKVTLLLEDRITDLQAEGIDIAVRIGSMADSSLVATQISSIGKICCASPAYLSEHGIPTQPAEISAHRLLHYSNMNIKDEWSWLFAEGETLPDLDFSFAANNAEALSAMALQGMGITVLPEFSVAEALKNGKLIQIYKNITPPPSPLYAVRVSRQFTPARVRAFIEYLKNKL